MVHLHTNKPQVRDLSYDPEHQVIEGSINNVGFQVNASAIADQIDMLSQEQIDGFVESLVLNTAPSIMQGYRQGDAYGHIDLPNGESETLYGMFDY